MSDNSPAGLIQYTSEIKTLADLLEERSVVYARGMDKNGPLSDAATSDTDTSASDLTGKAFSHPTTGMTDLDKILAATLGLVGLLHHTVADAMYNHGSKLISAYNRMQEADAHNRDDILRLAASQGITPQDPSGIDPSRPSPIAANQTPFTRPQSFTTGNSKSVPVSGYTAPINLRAPSVDKHPAPLQSTPKDFLKVNYSGLRHLADALNSFVSTMDPQVTHPLRDGVERVVSDDTDQGGTNTAADGTKWLGTAAQTFKNMFRVDIGTMNGLNCVMCGIAQIVANAASQLSVVEYTLEAEVANYLKQTVGDSWYPYLETVSDGDPSKYLAFDYGRVVLKVSSSTMGGTPTALVETMFEQGTLDRMLTTAQDAANKIRRRAGAELAGVNEMIAQSLDLYSSYSSTSVPSTENPETALTNRQAKDMQKYETAQENSLSSAYKALNGGDVSSARSELRSLGGDAGYISTIMTGLGDLTGKKALTTGGKLANTVGAALPIIACIGLDLL